jgi:hypothetical protein
MISKLRNCLKLYKTLYFFVKYGFANAEDMVFLYLTNIKYIVNAEVMTLLCHHFVVHISIYS